MKPTISVITAAYNAQRYIGDCIASVQRQKCSYEHIIVDDGSTDETANIVQSQKDSRIRYLRQKNQGPGAARNLGVRKAKGNLVVMLDSDDMFLPKALEYKSKFLRTHPKVDVVIASCILMHANGEPQLIASSNLAWRHLSPKQLMVWLLQNGAHPDGQPMWRKGKFLALGGYKPVRGEDIDLLVSALLRNYTFGYLPMPTGLVRVTPGSLSRGGQNKKWPRRPNWNEYKKKALKRALISADTRLLANRSAETEHLNVSPALKSLLQKLERFSLGRHTVGEICRWMKESGTSRKQTEDLLYFLVQKNFWNVA